MSFQNYGPSNFVWTLNGRATSDWGEAAQPYTDEEIRPMSTLRQGQGASAVFLDAVTTGRRVVISLTPGSPDSAYYQGLYKSKAVVTGTKTQIGTLEAAVGTEGRIVSNGQSGRAGGSSVTDDVYTIEFNLWDDSRGGE